MDTRSVSALYNARFNSVPLMLRVPESICGWSRNAVIAQAALSFAQIVFDDVGELAADSDVVALADLIDTFGVERFPRLSARKVNIQKLVDDYKSRVFDFAGFLRYLEIGAIDPAYLLPRHLCTRKVLDCGGPGYFGVDFSPKAPRRLFCVQVLKSLSAATDCEDGDDDDQPADRGNLDKWLHRAGRNSCTAGN
jgi:hypothetical protein